MSAKVYIARVYHPRKKPVIFRKSVLVNWFPISGKSWKKLLPPGVPPYAISVRQTANLAIFNIALPFTAAKASLVQLQIVTVKLHAWFNRDDPVFTVQNVKNRTQ